MQEKPFDGGAVGIRPGHWRPEFEWEHIAWILPPWPDSGHICLDLPETVFTRVGETCTNQFLSHVNPNYPALFPALPKIAWESVPGGIAYERVLPNGVRFGGSVVKGGPWVVALELYIENGSEEPLTSLRTQTCAFLKKTTDFSAPTNENKFVHTAEGGWVAMARLQPGESRPVGRWHAMGAGPVADLPVAICVAEAENRLLAMTWFDDTACLWGNEQHPCMHADPGLKDLAPGERASARGEITFFDGPLEAYRPETGSGPAIGNRP